MPSPDPTPEPPEPAPEPDADPGPGPGHRTRVVERGSFASARCDCGWKGPARRARDRARRDALSHAGGMGQP